mmetsp:Transcript_4725/g.11028  ORF Transcript_4725/g.11028 Transcript_4725/m.11028 type:complete len:236 (+) Transcript_4725:45-752(+)
MAKTTWRQFVDSDPLYALMGEVQENKVFREDNSVNEENLERYCEQLFVRGLADKPKIWIEVWAAMLIPVEIQANVLERILRFGLQHKPAGLGDIIFELLKGMRVKVPAASTAIQSSFAGSSQTMGSLSKLLYCTYPKSPHSAWGWARVGWGWQTWWQLAEQILSVLEPMTAFDELAATLDLIEADGFRSIKEGSEKVLAKQDLWTKDRLGKAKRLLCKFGSVEEDDLAACLDATL